MRYQTKQAICDFCHFLPRVIFSWKPSSQLRVSQFSPPRFILGDISEVYIRPSIYFKSPPTRRVHTVGHVNICLGLKLRLEVLLRFHATVNWAGKCKNHLVLFPKLIWMEILIAIPRRPLSCVFPTLLRKLLSHSWINSSIWTSCWPFHLLRFSETFSSELFIIVLVPEEPMIQSMGRKSRIRRRNLGISRFSKCTHSFM